MTNQEILKIAMAQSTDVKNERGATMMEYRQLPHGNKNEKFSVLGLGMGGIGKTPADEIEAIIRKAIDNGINFFDLCTAGASYAPIGRAIKGCLYCYIHKGTKSVD